MDRTGGGKHVRTLCFATRVTATNPDSRLGYCEPAMRGAGCSNAGMSGSGAPGELAEGRG